MAKKVNPHSSFPTLHEEIPEPFNLEENLRIINRRNLRQRRDPKINCCRDRYVLFMIENSENVGEDKFNRTISNISTIIQTFCDYTKIAVMTFNENVYNEFCFNCYEHEQLMTKTAEVQYNPGSGEVNVAKAIECACGTILTESCGLPNIDEYKKCPAPIDVIVMTTAKSSDSTAVCEAAKCLHNQTLYDINVYAIGINNFNQFELDCIVNQNDLNEHNIFYMRDYDEFEILLNRIRDLLLKQSQDDPKALTCFNPSSRYIQQKN